MDPESVKMSLVRPEDVPGAAAAAFSREGIARHRGYIYIRAGTQVLRCEAGEAGEAVIRALEERSRGMEDPGRKEDPWLAVLKGDSRNAGVSGIRDGIRRCVILFEAAPGQDRILTRKVWDDLAPMERGDAAAEPETGRIALIKQAEHHTDEEIAEFTAAVIETIDTETGIQVQAGIGGSASELTGMKESLRQAAQAIATGRMFQPDGRVFCYHRQAMERLISAVPEEIRRQLRDELLSPETGKRPNHETMETVRAFFRNDLNLSTTARELFIHRNTLIYRLDKIRKDTGFDLRRFQDAAVFQMLSCIPDEEKEN